MIMIENIMIIIMVMMKINNIRSNEEDIMMTKIEGRNIITIMIMIVVVVVVKLIMMSMII